MGFAAPFCLSLAGPLPASLDTIVRRWLFLDDLRYTHSCSTLAVLWVMQWWQ